MAKNEKPKKMKRKIYEEELERLHAELVKVQFWLKDSDERIIVVFEGRDGAGKGGIIKRISERVSPRVFRTVALPAPNEREKAQLYFQRYMAHFPAKGEVVLFDRSWYNRAGVEKVMGFCTEEEYEHFMHVCPIFEKIITEEGVRLIKYWLEIGQDSQTDRFESRMRDPRKLWKLSSMDLEAHRRWYEYSKARDAMFAATHTAWAPWHVVKADDQKRARLNCISHLLSLLPYDRQDIDVAKELPPRDPSGGYLERDLSAHVIPEPY